MVMGLSTPIIISAFSAVVCTLALLSSIIIIFRLKGCLRRSFILFSAGLFAVYSATLALLLYDIGSISSEIALEAVKMALSVASLLILFGATTAARRLAFVPESILKRV
jgi:hypothetical protein